MKCKYCYNNEAMTGTTICSACYGEAAGNGIYGRMKHYTLQQQFTFGGRQAIR